MENDAAMAIILFSSGREKSSCLIGPMVKVILETRTNVKLFLKILENKEIVVYALIPQACDICQGSAHEGNIYSFCTCNTQGSHRKYKINSRTFP